eukprot:scaffold1741_cov262-Pinguiococcus_pyrenoidosus.AAC.25
MPNIHRHPAQRQGNLASDQVTGESLAAPQNLLVLQSVRFLDSPHFAAWGSSLARELGSERAARGDREERGFRDGASDDLVPLRESPCLAEEPLYHLVLPTPTTPFRPEVAAFVGTRPAAAERARGAVPLGSSNGSKAWAPVVRTAGAMGVEGTFTPDSPDSPWREAGIEDDLALAGGARPPAYGSTADRADDPASPEPCACCAGVHCLGWPLAEPCGGAFATGASFLSVEACSFPDCGPCLLSAGGGLNFPAAFAGAFSWRPFRRPLQSTCRGGRRRDDGMVSRQPLLRCSARLPQSSLPSVSDGSLLCVHECVGARARDVLAAADVLVEGAVHKTDSDKRGRHDLPLALVLAVAAADLSLRVDFNPKHAAGPVLEADDAIRHLDLHVRLDVVQGHPVGPLALAQLILTKTHGEAPAHLLEVGQLRVPEKRVGGERSAGAAVLIQVPTP